MAFTFNESIHPFTECNGLFSLFFSLHAFQCEDNVSEWGTPLCTHLKTTWGESSSYVCMMLMTEYLNIKHTLSETCCQHNKQSVCTYITADDSKAEECRWTIPNHVLKSIHIQTKVLHTHTHTHVSVTQCNILIPSGLVAVSQMFNQNHCKSSMNNNRGCKWRQYKTV